LVVMIESVVDSNPYAQKYHLLFLIVEWGFTIFFTIEYVLRLYSIVQPIKYATSFYGIIDLLAILPTYLSLFLPNTQYAVAIRILRLMRVFRIFKLTKFLNESTVIIKALKASRAKISVFMLFVLLLTTIMGAVMYAIEGQVEGTKFTSIPRSIYWAIVTLTTVGYGDISPVTNVGQFLAAVVMMMGYAVIAVPTGIVSAEMVNGNNGNGKRKGKGKKKGKKEEFHIDTNTQVCQNCAADGHHDDAIYCRKCGEPLNPQDMEEEELTN